VTVRYRWLAAILVLCLALPIAVSRYRAPDVPYALQFIPSDATVVVIIPSLTALWNVLQPHLSRMDAGTPCSEDGATGDESKVSSQLRDVRCELQKHHLVLRTPSEMTASGVDVKRPIVIGAMINTTGDLRNPPLVAALPFVDEAKIKQTIRENLKYRPCEESEDDKPCVRIVDGGYALIVANRPFADSALKWPDATARFWRTADSLFSMVRFSHAAVSDYTVGVTAMTIQPFPAVLTVYGDALTFGVHLNAQPDIISSNLYRFVTRPAPQATTAPLDGGYPVAVRWSDSDLNRYLGILSRFRPDIFKAVTDTLTGSSVAYRALPQLLKDSTEFTSMTALVADVRRGVPELSLVLSMPPTDADSLVLRLQQENAIQRHCALVSAASRDLPDAPPVRCTPRESTDDTADGDMREWVKKLVRDARLTDETLTIDPYRQPSQIEAAAFQSADYAVCLDAARGDCPIERRVRYVAAPTTDNDFRWLLPNNLTENERARLRSGQFRVVSYYEAAERRLWLALDLSTLRKSLALARASRPSGAGGGKVRAQFDPGWLALHGRVSVPEDVRDTVDGFARELRQYRDAWITAAPLEADRGVLIDARFSR
jgi:hypothetical protein